MSEAKVVEIGSAGETNCPHCPRVVDLSEDYVTKGGEVMHRECWKASFKRKGRADLRVVDGPDETKRVDGFWRKAGHFAVTAIGAVAIVVGVNLVWPIVPSGKLEQFETLVVAASVHNVEHYEALERAEEYLKGYRARMQATEREATALVEDLKGRLADARTLSPAAILPGGGEDETGQTRREQRPLR